MVEQQRSDRRGVRMFAFSLKVTQKGLGFLAMSERQEEQSADVLNWFMKLKASELAAEESPNKEDA